MKAAQIHSYGGVETVVVTSDVPTPTVKEGQVLVENYAASINAIDWKIRAGYLEKFAPIVLPATLCGDFAGKVVEVGSGVEGFTVGDEVYGQAIVLNGGSGTLAEFVAANAKNTAIKPQLVNFQTASALPLAGASALQAIEDHLHVSSGQKVLIHGAAGGVGHIAVQIAKANGAYVIATAKTADVAFIKSIGADEVIDYKTQKFEQLVTDVDAVFDTVGGATTDASFTVMKKGGTIVTMVGQPNQELAAKYGVTAIGQQTATDTAHLQRLAVLVESKKVIVHVDKEYPLEKVQDAFIYQEKTHPQGKVVVMTR